MIRKFVLLAAAALSAASCSEKLDAGKSCPLLCPEQAISLSDTTIDAVVQDTSVLGLPPIGTETALMLASHGDTLDARAIIRFDTLPADFTDQGVDSIVTHVDSAFLVAPIIGFDTLTHPNFPVTIEAYDVDTAGTDSVATVLASLFRPDRFLGSNTFAAGTLVDSVRIPINTDTVFNRISSGTHLRIGLRVVSPQGVTVRIGSVQGNAPTHMRITVTQDTAAGPVVSSPLSGTPVDEPFVSGPLADFTIIVKGNTPQDPTLISVGGVPTRRAFLRFDVPSRLVDSVTVVRASLLLTQVPNRTFGATDTVAVYPQAITAQPTITDVGSALQFLSAAGAFGLDSVLMSPADSGLRSFEIVGLVRTWRQQTTAVSPRTLALRSGFEAELPDEIDFFSTRAPAAVRPKLRITYVPKTSFGVP